MNRREFIGSTVALALGARAIQAGVERKLLFGFSLYGMHSLPLKDAIAACAKIGYDAIELAVMPDWPADPKKLSADDRKALYEQIRSLKLNLAALMENTPLDSDDAKHKSQLERLKLAAGLAHNLGGDKPPLIETILGGKVDQWETLKGKFVERLGDWAKLAEAAKVTICIKPHRMNAMNRPEQALWLLEQVKSERLRLAYDWSHFEQRDLKMDDTMKSLIPLSRFVHVKDTIIEKGQARFVLPGEGSTNYRDLISGLRKHGYAGCVCVEVSGMVSNRKDYDPLAAAKQCYENLKPAFA